MTSLKQLRDRSKWERRKGGGQWGIPEYETIMCPVCWHEQVVQKEQEGKKK